MYCEFCEKDIPDDEVYYLGYRYREYNIRQIACFQCAKKHKWFYLQRCKLYGGDKVVIDSDVAQYWKGQKMEHTEQCKQALAEHRDQVLEYVTRWPNHCRVC